jgi:hypothetical protein
MIATKGFDDQIHYVCWLEPYFIPFCLINYHVSPFVDGYIPIYTIFVVKLAFFAVVDG